MLITQSENRMAVRSLEIIKTFMALLFLGLGLFVASWTFTGSGGVGALLGGLVFALGGALLTSDIHYISLILDKASPSSITVKTPRGSDLTNFSITDVSGVRLQQFTGIGNGSQGPNDILQLKINNIDYVDIATTNQGFIGRKILRTYQRQGEKIASFINVPFEIKKINLLKEFIKDPNQKDPSL
jgi:hypothetical protein